MVDVYGVDTQVIVNANVFFVVYDAVSSYRLVLVEEFGTSRDLVEVMSRYFSGGTGENYENPLLK
jgi:hypothetical protein